MSHSSTSTHGGTPFLEGITARSLERDFLTEEEYEAALAEQQAALAALPQHDELTVERRTTLKHLGSTPYGSGTEELLEFSDGSIRSATITMPDERKFRRIGGVCRYVFSSGDALFTGPNGVSRLKGERGMRVGIGMIWLHHEGRHSKKLWSPKDVGAAAHQAHAALDHIAPHHSFDTDTVFTDSYSRDGMTSEAFTAIAEQYERTVAFSLTYAKCFAQGVNRLRFAKILLRQMPAEASEAWGLLNDLTRRSIAAGSLEEAKEFAGTLDLHPRNLIHELQWIPALTNGGTGLYAKGVPLDHKGLRIHGDTDDMSQLAVSQQMHDKHRGIIYLPVPGAHFFAVRSACLDWQELLWRNIREYTIENDTAEGINAKHVVLGPNYADGLKDEAA